jgi:hypothetical protein
VVVVLGGAAHTAWLSIFLGVAARRGDVETTTRWGHFTRAWLPMQIVHNFCCGMSDAILLLRGADHTRGRRCSCGLGGIPGHICSPLWDHRVGFGQLAPALQHIRAVTQLPFVARGNESSFDLHVRSRADAGPPLGEADFPHQRRIDISAGWWPGLKGVSAPMTRSAGLAGVPEGRGA